MRALEHPSGSARPRGGLPTAGVLSASERAETAAAIVAAQLGSGMIPWVPGGNADPWNHLEAAMACAAAGHLEAAEGALSFLADRQRPDGAWHAFYGPRGDVADERLDTNGSAYLGTALLLVHLAGGDVLERYFPALEAALGFVCHQQRPGGEVCWSAAAPGSPGDLALLAACSSIYASLRSGLACAELLGERGRLGEVEHAAERLRLAIAERPGAFADKGEYAMDWYYPVLAGALEGGPATARIEEGWSRFVRAGRGVLCTDARRWVTTAETAECAIACLRRGLEPEARALVSWTAAQRRPDGSYLTGLVYPERSEFPAGEATTYSAAAVLLADDALSGGPAGEVLAGAKPPGG